MPDGPQPPMPPPLTEDEKALLRRVCRVRKITDDEIEFALEGPALVKAAWWTFFWFFLVGILPLMRSVEGGSSITWVLLGVFPTFFFSWIAARVPTFLVIRRDARTIMTKLHDSAWTIQVPRGSSPSDWGFPTASVPVRLKSNEMERVEAWEILQRFSGANLSEKSEDSDLTLLLACGVDLLGFDETSISIANTGSGRPSVVYPSVLLWAGAPFVGYFCLMIIPAFAQAIALLASTLSAVGAIAVVYDGRASSITTFRKGKREVCLFRRGAGRDIKVHEGAIRVISDSDGGEFVGIPKVFLCVPDAGTAATLAGFLQQYVALPNKPPAIRET